MLLIAPAAYHRIVYNGEASPDFLTVGGRFLTAATAALALGIATDLYVVIGKIAESETVGAIAGALTFLVLIAMWHVSPVILRRRRDATGHPAE